MFSCHFECFQRNGLEYYGNKIKSYNLQENEGGAYKNLWFFFKCPHILGLGISQK